MPVPVLSEQCRIIEAMSHLGDERRMTLQRIHDVAQFSTMLRRAVLTAAFEGKLTGRHTDTEVIEELAYA